MNDLKYKEIMDNIGNLLMSNSDYPLYDAFLFSEAEEGSRSIDIYRNLPDCVLYMNDMFANHTSAIGGEIGDLWLLEPPEKRWARMSFVVSDGRFQTVFTYPDDVAKRINPDNDPDIDLEEALADDYREHREEVIRHYFGDKPIVYPPLTPPSVGQLFEL